MALNVVYLRVQGRLQQCHVSDGDMMVFNHYMAIHDFYYKTVGGLYESLSYEERHRRRIMAREAQCKLVAYAEKVVKSGQYLIIKECTDGVTSI